DRVADGKWDLQDFAWISPFIYVDNELSMSTGREVYGWPKTLAWLDTELSEWMASPHAGARSRLASVSTMVFPEVYAGQRQEPRVFLEVEQVPNALSLETPPDMESSLWPWVGFANMVDGMSGLMRDWHQLLTGPRGRLG